MSELSDGSPKTSQMDHSSMYTAYPPTATGHLTPTLLNQDLVAEDLLPPQKTNGRNSSIARGGANHNNSAMLMQKPV